MIMHDQQTYIDDGNETHVNNKQCGVGDHRLFLFGYCAGIPSFDDGIVHSIDNGMATLLCASNRTRIPVKRKCQIDCTKYTITLPVSRLVSVDDEQYVIKAWHQLMNSDYSKNPQKMLQHIAYKCWNTDTDILNIKLKIQ